MYAEEMRGPYISARQVPADNRQADAGRRLASIMQANVMQHLVLAPEVIPRLKADLMGKIDAALAVAPQAARKPRQSGRKPATR